MCGIFGSPTLTPSVLRMLPYLGIEMEARGRDAWGASDGNTILKHVGGITDTWHEDEQSIEEWEAGIFHTRGASHGSPKLLDNAHPFSYQKPDSSWVIGIHNGVISNHDELDKKYDRKCEVDSMHIWMHRAEGKPWSDLSGWGNLAWWENNDKGQRVMNLTRFNNDALHVARLEEGEWIFASTMAPIRVISRMIGNPVKRWFILDEYTHYWFSPAQNGEMLLWKKDKPLPFPRPSHVTAPFHGCGRSSWGPWDSYCYKCGTNRAFKESVLCMSCFSQMTSDFIRDDEKERALISAAN